MLIIALGCIYKFANTNDALSFAYDLCEDEDLQISFGYGVPNLVLVLA